MLVPRPPVGYPETMRLISLTMLAMLAATVAADTELYKWTDKDGTVHYSDQPGPGAEKITVQDVPTIAAPPLPEAAASPADTAFRYRALSISDPPNNGTVRDNSGAVSVTVNVVPPLRADLGHVVRVSLAGQTQDGIATAYAFANIDRGTHTVQASVIDRKGNTLMSGSSSFTLHRISKLLPGNRQAGGSSPGGNAPTPGGAAP